MMIVFGYIIGYYANTLKWKNIWTNFKQGGFTYKIILMVFMANVAHIFMLSSTIPAMENIFSEKFRNTMNYIFPAEVFMFFLFLQILSPLITYLRSKEENIAGESAGFVRTRLDSVNLSELEKVFSKLLEIDEVYLDENLSLDSFSQKAGFHPRVVSEYLNQIKKTSFKDFICEYRIKKAMMIMNSNPDLNATHAGLSAGFNSTSSFYRLFKKHMGISPDQYRRKKNIPKS
jgi:AraC-like DNA-binding protein